MTWALHAWPNLSMPPYFVFLPNQPSRVKWNLVSPQPHCLMPTAMLTVASAASLQRQRADVLLGDVRRIGPHRGLRLRSDVIEIQEGLRRLFRGPRRLHRKPLRLASEPARARRRGRRRCRPARAPRQGRVPPAHAGWMEGLTSMVRRAFQGRAAARAAAANEMGNARWTRSGIARRLNANGARCSHGFGAGMVSERLTRRAEAKMEPCHCASSS